MKITNTHTGPIRLPNGQELQPGVATTVRDWDTVKKNKTVAGWLDSELLTTSARTTAESAAELPADKDELIARLAAHGIKKTKTSSVETLQGALAEADAKAAGPGGDTLIGSDKFESQITLDDGRSVPLGDVVAGAHTASGLSVEAWNELPADERDVLLAGHVVTLNAEGAQG